MLVTSELNLKSVINKNIKISGIGFNPATKSCFKRDLLDHLQTAFPSMEISNAIPTDADILIINMDQKNMIPILEKQLPSDHSFVIMVVHEVTRFILPYLKLADHLIFINEVQKVVCEDCLGLEYPSSVLPYAFGEFIQPQTIRNNCFIYFEDDHFLNEKDYYETRIKLAVQWHDHRTIDKYLFIFEVPESEKEKFNSFKSEILSWDPRFELLIAQEQSIEDLYNLMSKSCCGQVFKDEISLEYYVENLEARKSWVLNTTLTESPILCAMQYADLEAVLYLGKSFYNFNYKNKSTQLEWIELVDQIINTSFESSLIQKNLLASSIVIDQLADLNIVFGAPLTNDFVFSVCFRNQEEKIIRCLESIAKQAGNFNFGIAIISDVSSDQSVSLILDFVRKHKLDICVVDNLERKYASRNYYNVAHLLVTNDESVIIEVDGDDFLSGNHVLEVLDSYYQKGALKTNGSYKIFPEEQHFSTSNEIAFHHSNYDINNPWSLKCTSWLHLRTAKRHLICQVELKYFLERKSKQWLVDTHDSAIQPRIIELAKDRAIFVKEILYCYDVSGDNHDHSEASRDEHILHSYQKMDKLYYPISYSS